MATATVKHYGKWPIAALNKEIDWVDDTVKCALTTSSHTPDQDVHDYFDDITAEVTNASGSVYVAGGQALANKSIGYTGGTNIVKLDADDLVWSNAHINDVKNLHIYDSTPGTNATRPLIGFGIIDTALNPNNGNLNLNFDTAGVLIMTAAA